MAASSVSEWRPQGKLYLWHYPDGDSNEQGWHLHADALACQSISDLIERMLASQWRCRRSLHVIPERPLPIYPSARWIAVSSLVLIYPKDEVEANFWLAEAQADSLLLTLGEAKLRELMASIVGIPQGQDDYAIGPDVDMRKMRGKQRWKQESLMFWSARPCNRVG